MKILFYLLLILCAIPSPAVADGGNGTLNVEMYGFHNDTGVARVILFRGKDGFPKNYKKAYAVITSSITNQTSEAVFTSLPPGSYAISALHDENMNQKMDVNWLGIPKEGVGTSNNASTTFGPPSYKVSSFDVAASTKTITINMKYLRGK